MTGNGSVALLDKQSVGCTTRTASVYFRLDPITLYLNPRVS